MKKSKKNEKETGNMISSISVFNEMRERGLQSEDGDYYSSSSSESENNDEKNESFSSEPKAKKKNSVKKTTKKKQSTKNTKNTTNNNEEEITSGNLSKATKDRTSMEENENKVAYEFHWNEGGEKVSVTGTFGNWSEYFSMNKDPKDQIFKCIVNLTKKKHLYKFIVDNVWKYTKNQPFEKDDKGNTNNFVDLTNYVSENNNNKTSKKKIVKKKKVENKKSEDVKIKKKGKISYGNNIPSKDELNEDAPKLQDQYLDPFNLNYFTNQDFIGRKEYLKYHKHESNTEEKSVKTLLYSPHVNLKHTLTLCEDKVSLMEMGFSNRFRNKACTMVYYSRGVEKNS